MVLVIRRPKAQIADCDAAMASSSAVNKGPPATAEDSSMATNSTPQRRCRLSDQPVEGRAAAQPFTGPDQTALEHLLANVTGAEPR
jgi:hypothetical protein